MPRRPFTRDQDWLWPPAFGELIGEDHPLRCVAEFVSLTDLAALGIKREPAEEGAPSDVPEMLLALWLYGVMSRTRSSRKIERPGGAGDPGAGRAHATRGRRTAAGPTS